MSGSVCGGNMMAWDTEANYKLPQEMRRKVWPTHFLWHLPVVCMWVRVCGRISLLLMLSSQKKKSLRSQISDLVRKSWFIPWWLPWGLTPFHTKKEENNKAFTGQVMLSTCILTASLFSETRWAADKIPHTYWRFTASQMLLCVTNDNQTAPLLFSPPPLGPPTSHRGHNPLLCLSNHLSENGW